MYFKSLIRYGLTIGEETARAYLSVAVALRFASAFLFGWTSEMWANKFGRRNALIYCQIFCLIGALASGKILISHILSLQG